MCMLIEARVSLCFWRTSVTDAEDVKPSPSGRQQYLMKDAACVSHFFDDILPFLEVIPKGHSKQSQQKAIHMPWKTRKSGHFRKLFTFNMLSWKLYFKLLTLQQALLLANMLISKRKNFYQFVIPLKLKPFQCTSRKQKGLTLGQRKAKVQAAQLGIELRAFCYAYECLKGLSQKFAEAHKTNEIHMGWESSWISQNWLHVHVCVS